jgi:hypothetical protein
MPLFSFAVGKELLDSAKWLDLKPLAQTESRSLPAFGEIKYRLQK